MLEVRNSLSLQNNTCLYPYYSKQPTHQITPNPNQMTDTTSEPKNNSSKSTLREVGSEAVWSLSTAKPGNGVEQLRDNNSDTYWQSDGAQPHLINIQFHKKTTVTWLWFYLNFKLDESYTPKKISLRVGTTFHDLKEIHVMELEEPTDWVKINVGKIFDDDTGILRTHFIQVSIILMHQNGRDTHVRQVKLFGPRTTTSTARGIHIDNHEPSFNTVELSQFATIR